jgi:hypothetical protein
MATNKSRRAQQPASPAKAATRGGTHSRMDSEDWTRLLLWGGTLAIVLLTAFLVVFGYYWTEIRPRSRTVLAVDSQEVSYSAMKRRMAYEYFGNPNLQNTRSIELIPALAYQNLIEELTTVIRAPQDLGVSVTTEEYDAAIRREVGVAADASQEAFGQAYRTSLEATHLNQDEYRRVLEAGLLEDEAKAKFLADAAAGVPQARAEVILTNDEASARQAIDRINAGEDWATVAKALSKESDVQTTGGLKEFQPENASPGVYDDYIFTAEIGRISEPLKETPESDQSRYYVVRVVERNTLPLTEEQQSDYQEQEWQEWLADAQTRVVIVDNWSTDFAAQNDAVTPLFEDAVKREEELQNITPIVPTPAVANPTAPAAATPPAGAPTPASGP